MRTHVFDARRWVAAVTFHLLDERIARGVSDESVERAVRRLERSERRGKFITVSHRMWGAMSNRQRLEWLLANGGTTYHVRDDKIAVVDPRD
jgi:hypothetical protein